MTLYGFFYNPCIYESAPSLVSLHVNKHNAELALAKHKAKEFKQWENVFTDEEDRKFCPFGTTEQWFVDEVEVLD